jgi:hypothetical protein
MSHPRNRQRVPGRPGQAPDAEVTPEPEAEPDAEAEPAVTTADTAALHGVTSGRAEPAKPRRIVISEGVMQDLMRLGEVVEPGTGHLLRRDADTGEIAAIDRRDGQPIDIPIV